MPRVAKLRRAQIGSGWSQINQITIIGAVKYINFDLRHSWVFNSPEQWYHRKNINGTSKVIKSTRNNILISVS